MIRCIIKIMMILFKHFLNQNLLKLLEHNQLKTIFDDNYEDVRSFRELIMEMVF